MCVGVVVVDVVVVFSFHSGVGFTYGDNAATSDFLFLFVFSHLLGKTKQTEEDCSFHTINGSVCLVQ